jgi:hypothetical protein
MGADEGVLDPWVAKWFADNPAMAAPRDEWPPEMLELARGNFAMVAGQRSPRSATGLFRGFPFACMNTITHQRLSSSIFMAVAFAPAALV